jgi:hypothetical protein
MRIVRPLTLRHRIWDGEVVVLEVVGHLDAGPPGKAELAE